MCRAYLNYSALGSNAKEARRKVEENKPEYIPVQRIPNPEAVEWLNKTYGISKLISIGLCYKAKKFLSSDYAYIDKNTTRYFSSIDDLYTFICRNIKGYFFNTYNSINPAALMCGGKLRKLEDIRLDTEILSWIEEKYKIPEIVLGYLFRNSLVPKVIDVLFKTSNWVLVRYKNEPPRDPEQPWHYEIQPISFPSKKINTRLKSG